MAVTDTSLEFTVYSAVDPTVPLAMLPSATSKALLRQLNEQGRGSCEVLKSDTTPAILQHGNMVKVMAGGERVAAFIIDSTPEVEVDAEERPRVEISGPGVLAVLEDAVLYPETGLTVAAVGGTPAEKRVFNFASGLFNDATWGWATKVQQQNEDVPELIRPWTGWPTQWPDIRAEWLWDRVSTNLDPAPVGDVYFRRPLVLEQTSNLFFYMAADDEFEFWLNGELLVEGNSWRRPYGLAVTLPAGIHMVGVKATNSERVYDASEDSDLTEEALAETAQGSGEALLDVGIISGAEDGSLDLYGTMTRGQMATVAANTSDWLDDGNATNISVLPDPGTDQFTDIATSVHRVNINRLAAAGIVSGYGGGLFGPTDNVSRASLAVWLWKVLDSYGKAPPLDFASTYYTDVPQGTTGAEHIYALSNKYIMTGYGENLYGPTDDVTRSQVFRAVKRTLERVVLDQAGPAGFILSLYDETGPVPRTIFRSAATRTGTPVNLWKILGYPLLEPAMTPGEVLRHVVTEAAERNVAYMQFITFGFTDTLDSAGDPWASTVEMEFDVGETLMSMVLKLIEAGVDVEMTADLELRAWNRRGADLTLDPAPVSFRAAQNITTATVSRDGVPKNTILVRGAKSLFEKDEAASVLQHQKREAYLSLDDALTERQIDETVATALAITAQPQSLSAVTVVSTSNHVPLTDFEEGDWVRLYHDGENWEKVRVTSLTLSEDDGGNPVVITEVAPEAEEAPIGLRGSMLRGSTLAITGRAQSPKVPEQRLETWLRVAAKGTLRGDMLSAAFRKQAKATGSTPLGTGYEAVPATTLGALTDVDDDASDGSAVDGSVVRYVASRAEWEVDPGGALLHVRAESQVASGPLTFTTILEQLHWPFGETP